MNEAMTTKVEVLLAFMAGLMTAHCAPEINNRAGAVNVAPGEWKLQGRLDGGGDADVVVYHGPADGGTDAGARAGKIELKGGKSAKDLSGNGRDASLVAGAPVLEQNRVHSKLKPRSAAIWLQNMESKRRIHNGPVVNRWSRRPSRRQTDIEMEAAKDRDQVGRQIHETARKRKESNRNHNIVRNCGFAGTKLGAGGGFVKGASDP